MAFGKRDICIAAVVLLIAVSVVLVTRPAAPFAYSGPESPVWGARSNDGDGRGSIEAFTIDVQQRQLDDLQMRLELPSTLAVDNVPTDPEGKLSPAEIGGVDIAEIARIVEYWRNDFDWRKTEERLNKLPQFVTTIAGLRLHFVHTHGETAGRAVPLLLLHGWPGSVLEFEKLVSILSKRHQLSEDDVKGLSDKEVAQLGANIVFDIVMPSMPGYGFSDAANKPGLSTVEVARLYIQLMARLGHTRYFVQGGDWGGVVASHIAQMDEEHCLGVHVNFLPTIPPTLRSLVAAVSPRLALGDEADKLPHMLELPKFIWDMSGYLHAQATQPDTLGWAVGSSPEALATWIISKFHQWSDDNSVFTDEELVANLMWYWITNSTASSMRLYKNTFTDPHFWSSTTAPINIPAAYADFPFEMTRAPRVYLESKLRDLVSYTEMPRGGHFAAMEAPQLLAADVRKFVSMVLMRDAA